MTRKALLLIRCIYLQPHWMMQNALLPERFLDVLICGVWKQSQQLIQRRLHERFAPCRVLAQQRSAQKGYCDPGLSQKRYRIVGLKK